jgi:hypothetical protein
MSWFFIIEQKRWKSFETKLLRHIDLSSQTPHDYLKIYTIKQLDDG